MAPAQIEKIDCSALSYHTQNESYKWLTKLTSGLISTRAHHNDVTDRHELPIAKLLHIVTSRLPKILPKEDIDAFVEFKAVIRADTAVKMTF